MKMRIKCFFPNICLPRPIMPFMPYMNFRLPLTLMVPNLPTLPGMMDTCSWMDEPFLRDPRMDWILNPQITYDKIRNSNYSDNSYLSIPGLTTPQTTTDTPSSTKTTKKDDKDSKETKEEKEAKKKEKARKDRAANDKIAFYKEIFEKLAKVCNTKSPEYKALENEYKSALEEKEPEDKLKALEEVMKKIGKDKLRAAILEVDSVKTMLYYAGCKIERDNQLLKLIDVHTLRSEMKSKQNTLLTKVMAHLDEARGDKNDVLQFISTWNDTYSNSDERGFIRAIGTYMPTTDHTQSAWKQTAVSVANALLDKADTFSSENGSKFPKLNKLKEAVTETKKPIEDVMNKEDKITKEQVNKLADACDKLYAYLRMQEAILANREIRTVYSKDINELKPGTITENIVITETKNDLTQENITISDSDLDEIPKEESISDGADESGGEHPADNDQGNASEHDTNGTSRVEYLTSDGVKALEKKTTANSTNYYTTTNNYMKSGYAPQRAFMVAGDKLIELSKNNDGNFVIPASKDIPADAKDVRIQEILDYNETAKTIQELIDNDAIKVDDKAGSNSVYVSTGVDADKKYHHYIFKDNKFYEIQNCKEVKMVSGEPRVFFEGERDSVKLSEISSNDLTTVDAGKVPSKADEAKNREAKVANDVKVVEEFQFGDNNDYIDLTGDKCDEIAAKISGKDKKDVINKFKKLDVEGYFVDTLHVPNRYFKYEDRKLKYLPDVTDISDEGIMTIKKADGTTEKKLCPEYIKPGKDEENAAYNYGMEYAKAISGYTNNEELKKVKRSLNTFELLEKEEDIIQFMKAYYDNIAWYEFMGCKFLGQIKTEAGIEFEDTNKFMTKRHYFKAIAKQILKVVAKSQLNRNTDEYKALEEVANTDNLTEQKLLKNIGLIEDLIDKLFEDDNIKKILENGSTKEE